MAGPTILQASGAAPHKQTKYTPIFTNRFFTGLWTQRNPLRDPSDHISEKFYGGRPDALIGGQNIELTNRLTLARRPGLLAYSTQTVAQAPDAFYSFRRTTGGAQNIDLIVDTPTNIYNVTTTTLASIFTKSAGAGQGFFQGVGNTLYFGDGVDQQKWNDFGAGIPGNNNGNATNPTWNWGIAAPAAQPSVTSVASGSASTVWQANTIFSAMGLTVDSFGQVWQLIGVNYNGTNTANAIFGTAGNGSPTWNQGLYGTTTEGSGTPIVWKNLGQISQWQATTSYGDAGVAGVSAPVAIYDPTSTSVYLNLNNNGGTGTSGTKKPLFNGAAGSSFWDNNCHWFFSGKYASLQPWKASTSYTAWYTGNLPVNRSPSSYAIEPFIIPPSTQPIYLQAPTNTGTSGASYTPFQNNSAAGTVQPDAQLVWLSLGSGTWVASTNYTAWQAQGTTFSVVNDGVNMQVCITGGLSGTVLPGTSDTLSAAANASGGNTAYTGTFSPVLTAGRSVVISGFTTAANNGTFTIATCTATTLTVNNANGVAESHAATAVYNPWAVAYGQTTQDGTATWVCVGPQVTWVAGSGTTGIWHLPLTGFQPPQASQAFGGSTINSNTSLVETVITSGKSGTVQPTWGAISTDTADGGTALTLTQVTVSGTSTTYTGTITGGAANALAGRAFVITGFTNAGNNGLIYATASTATTLVCTTTTQVNETHAGTATFGLIWFAESAVSAVSLVWTKGYAYAYSYKARTTADTYSPTPLGGGVIPPGSAFGALPAPSGSATGAISTASPAFIITGPNAGAVNTVTGLGSTDPQVDTIVIWRSADGGGSGFMFELTEIPAPQAIGGIAQPWSFQDAQADSVLNQLIAAPVAGANNRPPTGFVNMAYHFGRIWGSVGSIVYVSGGPDTLVGNGSEAFPPINFFQFPSIVTRLLPTSSGLLVFTTSDTFIIAGGPQFTTFYSQMLVPNLGLLSYNALDVEGGLIFLFSSDSQFVSLDPSSGVSELGFAIGDQLANFNPANVYVTSHISSSLDKAVFVSDGSTGWFRLNPNQAPDGGPVWSPKAVIVGGCKAVQSIETSPGTHKLLVGGTAGGGLILNRDLNTFSDNGSFYSPFFTMGSFILAQQGQIAELSFIACDFNAVGSQPTVSFLLDEISGTFTNFSAFVADPPQLTASTSVFANRYYFNQTNVPAWCRHMQIKVTYPIEAAQNELLTLTIFGAHWQEE